MVTTRLFKSGNSQAIRIPKELRRDEQEYLINKIGSIYVAYPKSDPWAPTRETIGAFPSDFCGDRKQPSVQEEARREDF